jgi:transcriptional regulator with XRE-family HTH domain
VTGTNASNGHRDHRRDRRRPLRPDEIAYPAATVRTARQRAHLEQEDVVARVGTSMRTVTRWERVGVPYRARYLGRVEDVLGLGPFAERGPAPAPARPAPPVAPPALPPPRPDIGVFTMGELLGEIARRHAALEAGHLAPPTAPAAAYYRWSLADAPSAQLADTPVTHSSDRA